MTKVNVKKSIKIPANIAWEMLSSFRGIEKYSPIERSITEGIGVGAKRTCYLPDGAEIFESLDRVENDSMEMQYSITQGPFPVEGYVSTIRITQDSPSSCTISWGCEFESTEEVKDSMIELFSGFYNVIIDSLENLVLSQN